MVVLKFVAAGALGKNAGDGIGVYAAGLFFHYLIAFLFTLFFFWIYPSIPFFRVNRVLTAIVYGLFTWVVMNLAIVPLSRIGRFPSDPVQALIGAAILICMIGLPLSCIIGKFYARNYRRVG